MTADQSTPMGVETEDVSTQLKREDEARERDRECVRQKECRRLVMGIAAACDAKWATVTNLWQRLCVEGPYESLVASIVDTNASNEFKTPSVFLDYYCFYGGSNRVGMAGVRELDEAIRRDPFDPSLFEMCLDRAYIYYLQSRGPRVLNDEECALIDEFFVKAGLTAEERLVFEVFHGLKQWRRPIVDNDFMAIHRDALCHTAEVLRLPEERARVVEREAFAKVRKAVGGYDGPLRALRGWRFHVLELADNLQQLQQLGQEFQEYCAQRLGISSKELMEQFVTAGDEQPSTDSAKSTAEQPPEM